MQVYTAQHNVDCKLFEHEKAFAESRITFVAQPLDVMRGRCQRAHPKYEIEDKFTCFFHHFDIGTNYLQYTSL